MRPSPPTPVGIGLRFRMGTFEASVWILMGPLPFGLCPSGSKCRSYIGEQSVLSRSRVGAVPAAVFSPVALARKGVVNLSGIPRTGPQRRACQGWQPAGATAKRRECVLYWLVSEGQPGWSWKGRLWSSFHGKRKRSIRLSFQIYQVPLASSGYQERRCC